MHYEHLVDWMVLSKNQAFPFTEAIICVVNLLMLQLRIFLSHLRAFLSQMSHLRAFLSRIRGSSEVRISEFTQNF